MPGRRSTASATVGVNVAFDVELVANATVMKLLAKNLSELNTILNLDHRHLLVVDISDIVNILGLDTIEFNVFFRD